MWAGPRTAKRPLTILVLGLVLASAQASAHRPARGPRPGPSLPLQQAREAQAHQNRVNQRAGKGRTRGPAQGWKGPEAEGGQASVPWPPPAVLDAGMAGPPPAAFPRRPSGAWGPGVPDPAGIWNSC